MSPAALPARYGIATKADESHPRFSEYQAYRSGMSRLMVDSADFRDWLPSSEHQERLDDEAKHPRFPEWQAYFRRYKLGSIKTLPNGKPNAFPENFRFWLSKEEASQS